MNHMLINFLHFTKKYHKGILGMIIVSTILIMSQISLHAFMYQQNTTASQQQLSISVDISEDQHCATTQSVQCQSFLSLADNFSINAALSVDLPQFSSLLFIVSFIETALNKQSFRQINIFNFIIKTLFPPISIQLHSYLI
jgi:hypothetical protein